MPHRPTGPFPSLLQGALARTLKDTIAGQVVALFNDRSRGEGPVVRASDGLFGPHAVAWRVHGDVTSMMVGGIAGLLLQMLHPAVLAGVWDHSNFRADMHGRLRRTARFIALTTYGGREEAEAAIARVRRIHDRVGGTLPDGTPYAANDPALLAWVHVTEATSFLDAWIRYAEPGMPAARPGPLFRRDGARSARRSAPIRCRAAGPRRGACSRQRGRSCGPTPAPARSPGSCCTPRAPTLWRSPCRRSQCRPRSTCCRRGRGACTGCAIPAWPGRCVRAGTLGVARTLRWAFA